MSNIIEFINSFASLITQAKKSLSEYLETENGKNLFKALHFYSCVANSKVIEHEALIELFPEGFNKEILLENWKRIESFLWDRRPQNLMINNREERYKQLLLAQDAGAYIATCRGVYPEVEKILREEFIFSSEPNLEKGLAKKVKELTEIRQNPWGIDENASLEEVGIFNTAFLCELQKCFSNFSPKDAKINKDGNLQGNRHFHGHGWSDYADYVDGLNALFLFDMVMQLSSNLKNNSQVI